LRGGNATDNANRSGLFLTEVVFLAHDDIRPWREQKRLTGAGHILTGTDLGCSATENHLEELA
jgi:hypothetical protein